MIDTRLKDKMAELKKKITASNPGYDYDEFHEVVGLCMLQKCEVVKGV